MNINEKFIYPEKSELNTNDYGNKKNKISILFYFNHYKNIWF